MSPVALQDEAGTHFPPWQFVEQQALPAVQAFPSVVQVAVLPDTVIAAHWPLVHVPEQHCDAALQLWPTEVQAPLAHVPPVQLRLQHSSFAAQVAPATLQNWVELHLPVAVLQAVEQQSAFLEQLSPPAWQAFWTGVVHVPPLHWPEQQSLALEHAVAPARHCPVGSTHTFAAQEFVQQSALDPQTRPTALHCVASTHVPLHAPEQHSEGSVQPAGGARQEAAGLPEWPEWHAAPPSRSNDARTESAVLPGECMRACST